jgi:hypothetical protein
MPCAKTLSAFWVVGQKFIALKESFVGDRIAIEHLLVGLFSSLL